MNKILVCSEDSLFTLRICRILMQGNYAYDVTKSPIRKDDLVNYGLLVVHSSYHLMGLHSFIEHLVLSKIIPVLYVSSTIAIGEYQMLLSQPFFVTADENKMDVEMPVIMRMVLKYTVELRKESEKTKKAEFDLENERTIAKCKKLLWEQGLSEAKAHSLIQKTAMNHHESLSAAAERILNEKHE